MNNLPHSQTPIRATVISSVQPEPTTAGQVKLYRHLESNREINLIVHATERRLYAGKKFRHRLIARLERTALKRWIADCELRAQALWLDTILPPPPDSLAPGVVITMAHGNGCWAAERYARKYGLPLVTFFDDWWPEMDKIHSPFRPSLNARFLDLYRQSDLALCICDGMLSQLGPHSNAEVLYPIPAKTDLVRTSSIGQDPFCLFYHGNLGTYGDLAAEALKAFKGHKKIRLEFRGSNPAWPRSFQQEMQQAGLWHDYAPRAELQLWQARADAFLVPMVFEESMRRRMETSFPSKMLEMAQFGKPLVIWGPEYCSAVQWARQGDRALCVTDPNPKALRQALESLAIAPAEQKRLADAARHAACTDFNPDRIHAQFMNALRRTLTDRIGS